VSAYSLHACLDFSGRVEGSSTERHLTRDGRSMQVFSLAYAIARRRQEKGIVLCCRASMPVVLERLRSPSLGHPKQSKRCGMVRLFASGVTRCLPGCPPFPRAQAHKCSYKPCFPACGARARWPARRAARRPGGATSEGCVASLFRHEPKQLWKPAVPACLEAAGDWALILSQRQGSLSAYRLLIYAHLLHD
jgi:hypothetical protein